LPEETEENHEKTSVRKDDVLRFKMASREYKLEVLSSVEIRSLKDEKNVNSQTSLFVASKYPSHFVTMKK
jgi:hypothetical protein